jgi:hypothetical protein
MAKREQTKRKNAATATGKRPASKRRAEITHRRRYRSTAPWFCSWSRRSEASGGDRRRGDAFDPNPSHRLPFCLPFSRRQGSLVCRVHHLPRELRRPAITINQEKPVMMSQSRTCARDRSRCLSS